MPRMMKIKRQNLRKTTDARKSKDAFAAISAHSGGGDFFGEAVLSLQELAVHGERLPQGRKTELLDGLRRLETEPARPIAWRDAASLLKVTRRLLCNVRDRRTAPEVQQLQQAVAKLRHILENGRRRIALGWVPHPFRLGGVRGGRQMAMWTMAMGQAAHAVVKAASVVVQFVNCRDMKVSFSCQGEQTRVVVEGPPADAPSGPKERLRKISGVSCPYSISEEENSITYKSKGEDGRRTKTYRIPLGAASAAVNALVRGMVDGIREGRDNWSAPFTSEDAKALGRESRLENREFLKDCVVRDKLGGKGNQQYANSAQLYRPGMPTP